METPDKKTGLAKSFLFQRTDSIETPERPDAQTPERLGAQDISDVPNAQESKRPTHSDIQESERPNASGVSRTSNTPNSQTPKRSGRPNAGRAKESPRLTLRDRCTLYIERDVNERLAFVARLEGKERSEVVSDLLRQHLPKYRITEE